MPDLKVVSEYQPAGDQPQAIDKLAQGLENGLRAQVLKGVTGSGKTYTMAKVIERVNRPTLVLAHNKTLAAQLCTEFRSFFPNNAVEYFVSYYDYYQPEAYIASTDTYIEKDSAINEEIEKLRHSATSSLSERRDVIIVSSISCIYTLGDPIDYRNMVISLRQGMTKDRDELIRKLVEIQYERNDINFVRNKFRVRGDVVEIFPAYSSETAIRVEFFGDEVDRICEINTVTGEVKNVVSHVAIYPASHYIVPRERLMAGIEEIRRECDERVEYFRANNKLIEAQRIAERDTVAALKRLYGELAVGAVRGVFHALDLGLFNFNHAVTLHFHSVVSKSTPKFCVCLLRARRRLLGVQLNDEVLLNGNINFFAGGKANHGALEAVLIALHPGGDQEHGSVLTHQALEDLGRAAALRDLDHIAGLDEVGRNVDLLAVDGEVSMADELTGLTAGHRKAHAVNNVIQTALDRDEQIVTGLAGGGSGRLIVAAELLFEDTIDELDLLLFSKLKAVFALLLSHLAAGVAILSLIHISEPTRPY